MKQFVCEECQCESLIEQDGYYVCERCGLVYSFDGESYRKIAKVRNGTELWSYYGDEEDVILPPFITSMGIMAFENCTAMKTITIPGSVTYIGGLKNLTSLEVVTIEDGALEIRMEAFKGCTSLKYVFIPNSVQKIGRSAFKECTSLKSIDIPDEVSVIEDGTFYGCKSLEQVNFPANLNTIGQRAFESCENLRNIDIPYGTTSIGANAFSFCGKLYNLTIPDTVTLIGLEAFSFCKLLTRENVKLPYGFNPNGNIFYGCDFITDSRANSLATPSGGGCYVATCVYGSYDCPQVWTLRRYRDNTLGATWYGRLFIRTYYAISPTLVKWFGNTNWFKKMWKGKLDRMVAKLQKNGVEDTPYEDKNW